MSPGVWTAGRPFVRPLIFHINVFSNTTSPIRPKFGTRQQGNEALSGCAPHLDPPHSPSKRLAGQFILKSGILLKNLVRNYRAESAEIDFAGVWNMPCC